MLRPAPSLTRLLNPRSVAVIGGRIAESVALELKKVGFDGDIWPVNPKRESMAGLQCFASLDELPGSPDATYIGLAREAAVDAVQALRDMGAGGAIVHAAGFSEVGEDGGKLSDALVEAAGQMPVVGPNCWGVLNMTACAALWPDYHGLELVERGVAILAQSGNMAINFTMQARALPIAMVITVGNQTVTSINDLLDHLIGDERITAIGIHTEGLPDICRFSELACRAHEAGKPIVALKTGASEKGARATVSHTATLAGRDDLYDGLFARCGVARVRSVPAFLETLKLVSTGGPLPTGRITSLSCSGGEASLMADSAARRPHLTLPDLSEAETEAVRATLNEYVDVTNPLDYHTFIWADFDRMRATYAAMMQVEADIHCLVFDIPRADRADTAQYDVALDAWIAAAADTAARAAAIATMGECLPEATAHRLINAGIVPFFGVDEALDALNAAAMIGNCATPKPILSSRATNGTPVALSEADAKALLSSHGLRIPASVTCGIAQAGETAERIGFPVVVKASSAALAHKTEAGGVALNITTAQDAQRAADAMSGICSEVLVEQMITGTVAELIIGVTRDPQFGLALVIGAGGILTELVADSTVVLLPATRDDIKAALHALKVFRLIEGYRGKAGDAEATLDAIEAVVRFALAHDSTLEELDINPLMVLEKEKGAIAADALVRIRKD